MVEALADLGGDLGVAPPQPLLAQVTQVRRGVISLGDIYDVGIEPLINELKIDAETAEKLVSAAAKEIERLEAESKQKEVEKQLAQQTDAADSEQ